MPRCTTAVCILGAAAFITFGGRVQAQVGDQYWHWGWGRYGVLAPGEALDSARFDWSFVLLGSGDSTDAKTVERAKEILRLNPEHRFVLRVWPILQLGKLPNNRFQATMFDYLYAPGVRDQVLARARQQVRYFLDNVGERNVAGATFLEELPNHFTSTPFAASWREWKRGEALPWDMAPFKDRIHAELGAPFDLHSRKHRRWWGRRYAETISEIIDAIKQELGDKPVFYYGHALVPLVDDAEAAGRSVHPEDDVEVMPVRYQNVVGRGRADGEFVYPASKDDWERRISSAKRLGASVFSQISLPPAMRGLALEKMVSLARSHYAGNLGAFLFPTIGDPLNERAYPEDSYRYTEDLIRRFAWDQRINLELVDQHLAPTVVFETDRELMKVALGETIRVRAYVFNLRDPSWYGGSYARATLSDATLQLALSPDLRVEGSAEAMQALRSLGDLVPSEVAVGEWLVRRIVPSAAVAGGSMLGITLRTRDGVVYPATLVTDRAQSALWGHAHEFGRSGASWLELSAPEPSCRSAVEVRVLDGDIDSPMVARRGVGSIFYRGILRASLRLVMGPGRQGRIYPEELFGADVARFGSLRHEADGTVVVDSGDHFYSAWDAAVRSGERYRIQVEGWVGRGDGIRIVAQLSGSSQGRPAVVNIQVPTESLLPSPGAGTPGEIEVPQFDAGIARLSLHFFRSGADVRLSLRRFSVLRSDLPALGQDVSEHIFGSVPCEARHATVWSYLDRTPVVGGSRPRVAVRLVH